MAGRSSASDPSSSTADTVVDAPSSTGADTVVDARVYRVRSTEPKPPPPDAVPEQTTESDADEALEVALPSRGIPGDTMRGDSLRKVQVRETIVRRRAVAEQQAAPPAPARPAGAPVLVRVHWIRSTAGGLQVRRVGPDMVVLFGRAERDGKLRVMLDEGHASVDVRAFESASEVGARLVRAVANRVEATSSTCGPDCIVFFARPHLGDGR